MKIAVLFALIVVSAVQLCSAQTVSTTDSSSWIPKELKNELLYLEKYSEISTEESVEIIKYAGGSESRDEYLENIYLYNLVWRRKINSGIQAVIDNYELSNLSVSTTRDIRENLNNNIRFILKAEYSSKELVKGKSYSPRFYIYDQREDIRYLSYPSLEAFLKSYKSFNWYADNRITAETTQETIDDYIERNIPNERKPLMSKSTRTTILGSMVFVGVMILGYIAENS